jgi:hypothetical protein
MTSFSYQALGEKLPAGAIEFVGNNQLKANFSQITGDTTLTPQSSCVEGVVKFLNGLAALTTQVNENLVDQNMPPVQFASATLTGTPEQPEYEFTIRVGINTAQFLNNLKDPTE